MMTAELSVRKAVIEIRVVRIGRKQMTKSIFRQIPVRRAFIFNKAARTLKIRENIEVWGYARGVSEFDPDSFGAHVVGLWSMDGEMFRCIVPTLHESGCRRGEVWIPAWTDVKYDLDDDALLVEFKEYFLSQFEAAGQLFVGA